MRSEADWGRRRLHFVGVGGSGMSGLAMVCASLGAEVTGSDHVAGSCLDRLRAHGIDTVVGHAPENVPDGAELIYSSAVKPDNVERARARELGLRAVRRGELLAELAQLRRCIAIAGTHGKSTTAAMTVHALRGAGVLPSYVIGAALRDGSPSADWAAGQWLVVETDESDRTFLALTPEITVVTNVALEHMNEYATLAELHAAFAAFVARSRHVVTWNRPELVRLCRDKRPQTFETPELRLGPEGSSFPWRGHEVRLSVPGEHNVRNAMGALEACRLTGINTARAVASLRTFPGVRRRLEPLGSTPTGARVYEDYAHHANEVRATLAALRTLEAGRRVIAVFEPLLFTRTRAMAQALGEALAAADAVVVLELFPGSEAGEHHPGVSGRLVADAAIEHAKSRPVAWMPTAKEARGYLESTLGRGDACVVMGVGGAPQQLAHDLVGLA